MKTVDEMTHPRLSIGEVAARAGVATSALRYYERAGLLGTPKRVSGRRRYDPAVLERLAVIGLAKDAGFTIAEIGALLRGYGNGSVRWRAMAERKLAEVEATLARAEAMKTILEAAIACECLTLTDCAELARAARERAVGPG